jgi:hypothetical protein
MGILSSTLAVGCGLNRGDVSDHIHPLADARLVRPDPLKDEFDVDQGLNISAIFGFPVFKR